MAMRVTPTAQPVVIQFEIGALPVPHPCQLLWTPDAEGVQWFAHVRLPALRKMRNRPTKDPSLAVLESMLYMPFLSIANTYTAAEELVQILG